MGTLPTALQVRFALLASLVRRELESRYRGSVLGGAWPFASQIAQLLVFTYLFAFIFHARTPVTSLPHSPVSFGLWLFAGLIAWNVFVPGVLSGAQSILAQPNMVKKIIFPIALLPLVPVVAALVESVPGMLALAVLLLLFGHLTVSIVVLPVFAAVLVVFTAGVAYIVASVTVYFRDIPQALSPLLLLAFYVTPIVYAPAQIPRLLQPIDRLNPMSTVIAGYRWAFFGAARPHASTLIVAVVMAGATFAFGLFVFRRLRPGFADVL
jgi:lipopolysaccharide transport system permease protein